MFYIYILFSETINKYYIGQSQDPWNRLEQHNENTPDKYTGKSKDWTLKAVFEIKGNRSDAVKIEQFIKSQKSKKLTEKLIEPSTELDGKLAQLVRVPHVRD